MKSIRDGPLEKLWGEEGGGGEFSSRRFFFSLSDSLYEFFSSHSMNIFFRVHWRARILFHLSFPCAKIFVLYRPPPPLPPNKFSNGPSLS